MPEVKKHNFTTNQKIRLLIWADWLDGTDLIQGEGTLKVEEEDGHLEYCCLGVYIEMRDSTYFSGGQKVTGEFICPLKRNGTGPFGTRNSEFLPHTLARELGLYTGDEEGQEKNQLQKAFVTMNDDLRYTFKDIAKEVRHLVEHGHFTEETTEKICEVGGEYV